MIQIDGLDIGYKNREPLVSDARLSVSAGEMVTLVGRNGSGKSTLLKSIIALIPKLKGVCRIHGLPVEDYGIRERARLISYVSSNPPQMPAISVKELVSLGRLPYTGWSGRQSESDRIAVSNALKEVGLTGFAHRKMDQLSDGERQRVMIARALAQDTTLIVLDEPTAFLDLPNKYELILILSRLRDQGKSIIYSTHDLETAWSWADKFWVIHHLHVYEGSPEDLGITGLFDELFEDSDIYFDQSERRFKTRKVQRGTVQLESRIEQDKYWTRNALERIGFRIVDGPHVPLRIRVVPSVEGYTWIVINNREEMKFENIYTMIRFLLQVE